MGVTYNWGILGTGMIARKFARALLASDTGRLVAVGSRTAAKAAEFAREFPGVREHGSYGELLDDPEVQVVYIATPHSEHHDLAVAAAAKGRHILCEKPLAVSAHAGAQMISAARRAGVFLMEAMMYRCHPQTRQLVELIRAGAIGEPRAIDATFSELFPFARTHRAFNPALGGGSILDLGCYPLSLARLVAGLRQGRPFAEPVRFGAVGRCNEVTGVEEYTTASVLFPGGLVAQLTCGFCARQESAARIFGADGFIELPEPFVPNASGEAAGIIVHRHGSKTAQRIDVAGSKPLYTYEVDAVGAALAAGAVESTEVPLDDTLGNLRAMDAWRAQVGVRIEPGFPSPRTLSTFSPS